MLPARQGRDYVQTGPCIQTSLIFLNHLHSMTKSYITHLNRKFLPQNLLKFIEIMYKSLT